MWLSLVKCKQQSWACEGDVLGQSWVGYDAVKAKLNIWMFWKGTKGWCHTENEKLMDNKGGKNSCSQKFSWELASFFLLDLEKSFSISCSYLETWDWYKDISVIVSNHEIERKLCLLSSWKMRFSLKLFKKKRHFYSEQCVCFHFSPFSVCCHPTRVG